MLFNISNILFKNIYFFLIFNSTFFKTILLLKPFRYLVKIYNYNLVQKYNRYNRK